MDRSLYKAAMQETLKAVPRLTIADGVAVDLVTEGFEGALVATFWEGHSWAVCLYLCHCTPVPHVHARLRLGSLRSGFAAV